MSCVGCGFPSLRKEVATTGANRVRAPKVRGEKEHRDICQKGAVFLEWVFERESWFTASGR